MSDKFRNKYRIESARLKHWDYGWNAAYFITICTKDRTCFFGRAVDGKMVLNEIGQIARNCWLAIPEYFPFVKLADHIVMPNHVHGILVIDKPDDGRTTVETRLIASLQAASQATKTLCCMIICQKSSGGTKAGPPLNHGKFNVISPGNPVSMTTSSGMKNHFNGYLNTSRTIL